ncbi:Unknown protein, partial [Striga hermonthica]
STFDEAWTTTRPLGHGPPLGFSGPSQTPVTPTLIPHGVGATATNLEGDAGSSRAQEARAAAMTAMPPPPPHNPVVVQPGDVAIQGGAPTPVAGQAPGQQVVTMTREEMQRIAAAAAAQAVQQVASHTSHATTAPATTTGNQDEDVSSYGEGGVARDRAMERMAEQLR